MIYELCPHLDIPGESFFNLPFHIKLVVPETTSRANLLRVSNPCLAKQLICLCQQCEPYLFISFTYPINFQITTLITQKNK